MFYGADGQMIDHKSAFISVAMIRIILIIDTDF